MSDRKIYQLDIPRIIEYLRAMVRQSNKQELVGETGIPYTRLIYFARSASSTPNPGDLTKLLQHFMPDSQFVVMRPAPVIEVKLPQGVITDGATSENRVAA